MIIARERKLKKEIIEIGKRLNALRLAAGRSGNLSVRLNDKDILITATQTALGDLKEKDILKVDLTNESELKSKPVTTEFPLHSLIYKNFPHQAIIHCHPVMVNAYFAVYSDIKALTFETKLYLGNIPVVIQDAPAVTRPELVIEALKENNLVVLKNHGVVAAADNFKDALYLIETLEEAVRTCAVARLFKKEILDDLDKELKGVLSSDKAYEMFSKEHIQAIVDLVNKDEFIANKGREMDLSLQLAIKLDGEGSVYKFNFEKGKIIRLDYDAEAPFIISAPKDAWEMIFLGKLDPFVATTQGKMKLRGDLGKLSRWYVPFSRLFELFKQVKIK
ncbi:MAG: class II aldolase/adducin family protein [Candidatus Omnitrophica bacterium]|nr:class II aldolase/adducin family protein [Candidatus Omnitrophota bacterium]MDD5592144.1 class II aldolase/adducin family protein [Candidatus Omnitrophota bacterium]